MLSDSLIHEKDSLHVYSTVHLDGTVLRAFIDFIFILLCSTAGFSRFSNAL